MIQFFDSFIDGCILAIRWTSSADKFFHGDYGDVYDNIVGSHVSTIAMCCFFAALASHLRSL